MEKDTAFPGKGYQPASFDLEVKASPTLMVAARVIGFCSQCQPYRPELGAVLPEHLVEFDLRKLQ